MKTVFTLAVGFLIGRKFYVTYDYQRTLEKQKAVEDRLTQFLKENGWTTRETTIRANEILGNHPISK